MSIKSTELQTELFILEDLRPSALEDVPPCLLPESILKWTLARVPDCYFFCSFSLLVCSYLRMKTFFWSFVGKTHWTAAWSLCR